MRAFKNTASHIQLRAFIRTSMANRSVAKGYGVTAGRINEMTVDEAKAACDRLGIKGFGQVNSTPAPAVDMDAIKRQVRAELEAEMAKAVKPAQTGSVNGPVTITVTREGKLEKTTTLKGRQHPKFPALIKAAGCRMVTGFVPNVMLVGPTGTGKSHAAEAVANALGLKFYVASMMSQNHELLGFIDANGVYRSTQFRQAFEFGGVILLDEVDAWDAQVTLALNGALANGVAAFPDALVPRHKDCVIIAAANTWGNGATADFNGRGKLDAAFISRFPVKIDWHRDDELEVAISGDTEFATRVQRARAKAEASGLKVVIDPRHSQAGAALIAAGFSSDEAAKLTYLAGLTLAQVALIES